MCDEEHDEKCQICGLSPVLVENFRDFMMEIIREMNEKFSKSARKKLYPQSEESLSWCPVSEETDRDFLNDLAAIGMYRGRYEDDIEKFDKPRSYRSDDHIDAHQVCLFIGLTAMCADDFNCLMLVQRKEGKKILRVPGDARQTDDLEDKKSADWRDIETGNVKVWASKSAYLVHTRCWELLQGYGNIYRLRFCASRPSTLTPAGFWMTGMQTSTDHEGLRQQGSHSFDWIDHEEVKKLHNGTYATPLEESIPNDLEMDRKTEVAQAVRRSLLGEDMDLAIRKKLWDDRVAWAWQPPDKVELLGFLDESKITVFDTDPEAQSRERRAAISSLPLKIVGHIVGFLDLQSAFHFAMTNKGLRQGASKALDNVAQYEVQENHPWMLPHTPREQRYWDARLQVLSQEQVDAESKSASNDVEKGKPPIHWLAHLKTCLTSPTDAMRNRRRIWKAAEKIFEQAERRGFLEA